MQIESSRPARPLLFSLFMVRCLRNIVWREIFEGGEDVKSFRAVLVCVIVIIFIFLLGAPHDSSALDLSDYVTWRIVAAPEPGTIIMLGLGLIGIGVFLMLRKKK
jgi:hypothetical protein